MITIDKTNDSSLVLMRVCKYWYNIVTGIWGSLKLGTTTPIDVVTRKLERNQRLLDVLIDTEIDRGYSTPPGNAYQAIFAAIRGTSRWQTLVIETFPTQADLPEDLVYQGLQQCSNLMNRLRTLTIKSLARCRSSSIVCCALSAAQRGESFDRYNKFSNCHIIPFSYLFPHLPFRHNALS